MDDPGDPRLAVYANLKDADLADRHGAFIAEGPLVVRELLRSTYKVRSILVHEDKVARLEGVIGTARGPGEVPVFTVPPRVLDAVTGFHLHRGVLACGERGPALDARTILEQSRVLLVLEDLSNHDNVGGLFRVAAALGDPGAGVVLSPRCCDPLYRKALRVSIGHALRVPYARCHLDATLWSRLAASGYTILATGAGQEAAAPASVGTPARVAVVLGAEGAGLFVETVRAIRAAGGQNVRIPLAPGVDSLNVVVAAGILLASVAPVGEFSPGKGAP
ncbi:MAG: RNA methyltransferase [Phycisphaerae bacterium]|nr:RNA methyltransferase [Phycisphaerae bacterium]